MRLATPIQMKEIEKRTVQEFGISDELLMETAGALSSREIQLSFLPELQRGRVAIVCGPGNNGGDGLVVARHLYNLGYLSLSVFVWAHPNQQSELFKLQYGRAQKQGVRIYDLINEPGLVSTFSQYALLVDALFGTGFGVKRTPNEDLMQILQCINTSQGMVVSLDIPSGLNGTTGESSEGTIRAVMTLTFGIAKPGLYVGDGPEFSGKVRVLQIGFPKLLFREEATTHFAFNEKLARRWLPIRKPKSNKAQHGHLLVIAGKPGMWGAANLCCEAAYRIGAGYVTLAVSSQIDAERSLSSEVGSEILIKYREDSDLFEKKSAVVIGPGASTEKGIQTLIEKMIEKKVSHVLIDADALTVLSEMKIGQLPSTWILTPHSGEMSRLLKVKSEEIETDRFLYASEAAKKFGCLILLKGYRSILSDPEGRFAIIMSGNAGLAKAGTGDVLSGFIGSLLAQGVQPLQAAGTAAYFHGRLSDDWLRSGQDIRSLMPRDLLTQAPFLLHQLSNEE